MKVGSSEWNDQMFQKHPTPYQGIAGYIEKQRVDAIIRGIRNRVGDHPDSIVELGCEAGNLLAELSRNFPKTPLFGFDISRDALAKAQLKLGDKAQYKQVDITKPIDWQESAPSVIVCSETLEHIPDCEKAIQMIANLADEQSLVVLTVPLEKLKNQVKSLLRRLGLFQLFFKGIEENKSEWHVQDFSKTDFIQLVSTQFEVLQYKQLWGLHQEIIAKKKL